MRLFGSSKKAITTAAPPSTRALDADRMSAHECARIIRGMFPKACEVHVREVCYYRSKIMEYTSDPRECCTVNIEQDGLGKVEVSAPTFPALIEKIRMFTGH